MDKDSEQIASMVESGAYYTTARDWYATLYIGPIAERTFFLLIAVLAGLVAFFAFIAVAAFLPLTDHPGLLIHDIDIDEHYPQAVAIQPENTPLNPGLMQFFVSTYVTKRESYTNATYPAAFKFIEAQSDAPTFKDYEARYDRSNKQSPAAILGQKGNRLVTIRSVAIKNQGDPKVATVEFSTEIQGFGDPVKTNWTATLQFYYSDLVVTHAVDPTTGEETLETQDPQFQVVNYALTKAP